MPLPRSKPPVLQSIHPKPSPRLRIRCLRTKPDYRRGSQHPPQYISADPPKQAAFGPFNLPAAIREARRKVNEKPVHEKIPIVPKLDEEEQPIEWQPPEEDKTKIKVVRELNVEEQERKAKLKEREERIAEFEDLEKKLEGRSEKEQFLGKTQALLYGNEYVKEKTDNTVYPRDHIGAKFFKKKAKKEWKADVWQTKNYFGFLNVEGNRKRVAQAAAELVQQFQQMMNGDNLTLKLIETDTSALKLPKDLVLQNVDVRTLALPFSPDAVLPAMRLLFVEMKNQVRYSLTDRQINNISTGADFIRQILNPPQPVLLKSPSNYLYTKLQQIAFPPNVSIAPDKSLLRSQRIAENAARSARAKVAQAQALADREAEIRGQTWALRESERRAAAEEKRKREEDEQIRRVNELYESRKFSNARATWEFAGYKESVLKYERDTGMKWRHSPDTFPEEFEEARGREEEKERERKREEEKAKLVTIKTRNPRK